MTRDDVNLAIYFDVGIAVADRIIEFGPTIRPICLPFKPIDNPDHFKKQFVNLAGWGTDDSSNNTVGSLHINNLEVCCKFSDMMYETISRIKYLL